MEKEKILEVDNLNVSFNTYAGEVKAVRGVSFELSKGETLAFVGESGCGKTVTAKSILRLLKPPFAVIKPESRIVCNGKDVLKMGEKELCEFRGDEVGMIFQDPMTSLNPTMTVGKQIMESLMIHKKLNKNAAREEAINMLKMVNIPSPEKRIDNYPHEMSGGMRQRVMIAMAIILHPRLIVADEPTTALDVTVQNQIMDLLREINGKRHNAILFITHDLNLAKRICHRIAVMKDGRVVETGTPEEIFERPKEEYTRNLIEAVPSRMKPRGRSGWEGSIPCPEPVVSVKGLQVYYREGGNSLFSQRKKNQVVRDAEFEIRKGEILGLVGESGCGKTSLSKAILGMNRDIAGEIVHYSTRPQMIFQDPYSSLNPSKTVGWLLEEPLRARGKLEPDKAMSAADMRAAAMEMLGTVGLTEAYYDRRPFQLSGGQRQRISIGQALITRPGLVIADEPVSALDVTIQAQIMELMRRLQEELQLSYLFISHDINVIYQMSDRIMVMKEGKILEIGETEEVFAHPREAYTKQLLRES